MNHQLLLDMCMIRVFVFFFCGGRGVGCVCMWPWCSSSSFWSSIYILAFCNFFIFFFQSETPSAISILIPDFVTSIPQNYSFILLITYHSQNKLSSVHNHTMPVENFRKACLAILHCFDGAFLSIMKYNNSR